VSTRSRRIALRVFGRDAVRDAEVYHEAYENSILGRAYL